MNPVSEDLKDWFEDSTNALGEFNATTGWSIHVGSMPDTPDTCIAIYDTNSRVKPTMNRVGSMSYNRFHVRVRATAYLEGYAKAQEIVALLVATYRVTLSVLYETFRELTGPAQMPRDEQGRFLWVINGEAVRHFA